MDRDRLSAALTELGLFIGALLAAILGVMAARAIGLWPSGDVRALSILSGPLITVLAALGYRFLARRMIEADIDGPAGVPMRRAGGGEALAIAGAGTALALGGSMVISAALDVLGIPATEQPGILEIVEDARTGVDRIAIFVLAFTAIVLAPIVEEWLFRGLFFTRVRNVSGRLAALALSGPAFAVIHANLSGLLVYIWLGVVFALALERSGRLSVAIAVHMGNNAVAFTLLLLGVAG